LAEPVVRKQGEIGEFQDEIVDNEGDKEAKQVDPVSMAQT
jgi:hypothetical protein